MVPDWKTKNSRPSIDDVNIERHDWAHRGQEFMVKQDADDGGLLDPAEAGTSDSDTDHDVEYAKRAPFVSPNGNY